MRKNWTKWSKEGLGLARSPHSDLGLGNPEETLQRRLQNRRGVKWSIHSSQWDVPKWIRHPRRMSRDETTALRLIELFVYLSVFILLANVTASESRIHSKHAILNSYPGLGTGRLVLVPSIPFSVLTQRSWAFLDLSLHSPDLSLRTGPPYSCVGSQVKDSGPQQKGIGCLVLII